jgi:hypothetical protein
VDHSKRIWHITRGFYGATNAQTITKYDDFLDALRKREIFENVTYEIIDDVGETKTVNGVLSPCTVRRLNVNRTLRLFS